METVNTSVYHKQLIDYQRYGLEDLYEETVEILSRIPEALRKPTDIDYNRRRGDSLLSKQLHRWSKNSPLLEATRGYYLIKSWAAPESATKIISDKEKRRQKFAHIKSCYSQARLNRKKKKKSKKKKASKPVDASPNATTTRMKQRRNVRSRPKSTGPIRQRLHFPKSPTALCKNHKDESEPPAGTYVNAATTIQRAARRRQKRSTDKYETAATHIQKIARGRQHRTRIRQKSQAAESIQRIYRGASGRRRSKKRARIRRHDSATFIQKSIRGRQARKQHVSRNNSARMIQKSVRRRQAGKRTKLSNESSKLEFSATEELEELNAMLETALDQSKLNLLKDRSSIAIFNDALSSALNETKEKKSSEETSAVSSDVDDIMGGFGEMQPGSSVHEEPSGLSVDVDNMFGEAGSKRETPSASRSLHEAASPESSMVFATSPKPVPPDTPSRPTASLEDMSGILNELGDVDDIMGDMLFSPSAQAANMFISTDSLPPDLASPKMSLSDEDAFPKRQKDKKEEEETISILHRRGSQKHLMVNTQGSVGSSIETPSRTAATPKSSESSSIPPTPKGMLPVTPKHLPARSPSARELWNVLSNRGVSLGNVSSSWEMMLDPDSNKTWYRHKSDSALNRWDPPPEGSPAIVRHISSNVGIMPMPSIDEGRIFDDSQVLESPKKRPLLSSPKKSSHRTMPLLSPSGRHLLDMPSFDSPRGQDGSDEEKNGKSDDANAANAVLILKDSSVASERAKECWDKLKNVGLPTGKKSRDSKWETFYLPKTQEVYYHCASTGESTWVPPLTPFDWGLGEVVEYLTGKEGGGWCEAKTEHGEMYYVNKRTDESRWEKPRPSDWGIKLPAPTPGSSKRYSWREMHDLQTGDTYFFNTATGESSWEKPSPKKFGISRVASTPTGRSGGQWQELVDDNSGVTYYYNAATGESRWEKPPPMQYGISKVASTPTGRCGGLWEELIDDNSGVAYYYNKKTGESRWEKPDPAEWSAHASSKMPIETDEWEGLLDPRSGECFYRNKDTDQLQWDTPVSLELAPRSRQEKKKSEWAKIQSVDGFEYNTATGETRSMLSSPSNGDDGDAWEEVKPLDGSQGYWYNKNTGESQWSKPSKRRSPACARSEDWWNRKSAATGQSLKEGLWEERKDEDGRVYFFNPSTNQSTWERPQNVAFAISPSPHHDKNKKGDSSYQVCRSPDGTKLFSYDFNQGSWRV